MKVYTEKTLNRKLLLNYTEEKKKNYTVEDEIFDESELGADEVLVKINSCSLPDSQHPLLKKIQSLDNALPIGQDISGSIIAVGKDVQTFEIEDQVTGVIPANSGECGCANYCRISHYDIVKKAENVSHVDACSGIGDSVKAYTALFYQAKIQSGETLLILDACTGYGTIANQLAQYWGAKVIVVGSTDEEIAFLQNLEPPASQVVDLRNKRRSLASICLEETGGLGVDCILDNKVELYSEEYLDTLQTSKKSKKILPTKFEVISSLAVGGRWVTQQHNLQLDPPDSELLMLKCASLHFLFEQSWSLSRSAHGRYLHILNDIMKKMSKGVLRPTVHHTVLFDDCLSCLQNDDNEENTIGKIVVKTS
eukprot:TCONS_00009249-protein